MSSTYSNLKIQLMATGENSSTWGDVTNTNLGTALEEAIVGSADVSFSSGNVTLTLTDTNGTQTARNMRLRCTGTTGGATRNLVVPSIEKPYLVQNDCADSILVKTAAGSGITVPTGKTMWVYSNGTNVVDAVTHLTSLTLGTPLAVAQGGTGATDAATARANLGAGTGTVTSVAGTGTVNGIVLSGTVTSTGNITLGGSLSGVSLTTQVSGTLPIANGGTNATTVGDARINLLPAYAGNATKVLALNSGATDIEWVSAGGAGTVTSVNASTAISGLSFSGGPITSSGTLTLSGTLGVAGGGTGATTAANARVNLLPSYTGNGGKILALNALGTDTEWVSAGGSGTVTSVNATTAISGLSFSGGPITAAGTLTLSGTLGVAGGGTGQTTLTSGAVLIGAGTSGITSVSPGTLGNVLASNGSAWVSQAGNAGTVTSVGGTGTVNGITLSGTITSSGSLTLGGTLSGVSLTTQVSGTLPAGNGGTGLTVPGTAGNVLTSNGSAWVSQAGGAGTVTSVSGTGTVNGLTLSGTVTSSGSLTLGGTLSGVSLTTQVSGTLPIANGGTGATTASTARTALGLAIGSDVPSPTGTGASGTWGINISGNAATATSATSATSASSATTATTATTANALNTSNNYQVNSLGVGTAGSGTAGEIRATNNITAYYSSDITLKENVADIESALDKVRAIGGKTFDWTDAYIEEHGGEDEYFLRKKDFGVIAQDVEAVFPVAVRKRDDGKLAVDYEKLCALAFQAIKELEAKVEALTNDA